MEIPTFSTNIAVKLDLFGQIHLFDQPKTAGEHTLYIVFSCLCAFRV